jgi:hypothetical protein
MSSWAVPDDAEVARTLSAVGEPTLRQLFFRELENPEWLKPLARLGVFADPGIIETDDGYKAWPWPEGNYILRIAADRPAEVTVLLKKLTSSKNPWVQRTLVEIATVLPIEYGSELVPGIAKLLATGPDRVDQRQVANLIERMLDEGKHKEARKLLGVIFNPLPADENEMVVGSRRRISSPIDDYWFKELLARLAPRLAGLGLDGLKLTVGWLNRAVRIRTDGMPDDSFVASRPSIGPHPQNAGLYDIDDALIDTVRDVGVAVTRASGSREAIDFLNRSRSPLVRRIGIEVAAAALESGTTAATAVGYEMLRDESLLGFDARPEYAHLARVMVPRLAKEQLEEWTQFILRGSWLPGEENLRRMAAWPDNNPSSVSSEEINQQRRRLTHRLLSAFSMVLTGELAERFAVLTAEFGEVSHPEFTSYVESFRGPTSPVPADKLGAMTTSEVVDYLESWEPQPSHHFGPTVLGLARTLEPVVAADPARFEQLHRKLVELKPPYVRGIVSGWEQAARNGYQPSTELWDTLAQLANHRREEMTSGGDADFDDDPRWQWVHRALVSFATAIMSEEPKLDSLEHAWRLLKPLTDHFDPTPAFEEEYGGSNMDPLTLSLNTVRPSALRGAFQLFTALTEEGSKRAIECRDDVLSQLNLHAGPSIDPSLAVAAVFGESVGRIWNANESWVTDHWPDLAGAITSPEAAERAWADVVVSVALRVHHAGVAALRMLRPALEAVFSAQYVAYEHTAGWRERRSTVQSAASHVVWTVTQGAIQLDDPLMAALFGGNVDVDTLSEALGHLGWQLMHIVSDQNRANPPAEFLERARTLIESRLAAARKGDGRFEELSQFHWWIRSNAFDIDWWLPILAEITEAGARLDNTLIGEALEKAAEREPLTTIVVFERLIDDTDYWHRYDLMQHAAKIISRALESGDHKAVARARSMQDAVAREGHLDIIDQIERLTHRLNT